MPRKKLKSNICLHFFLFSSSDRDLTYACVGIIVNMMSDPEQRPQFRQQVKSVWLWKIFISEIKETILFIPYNIWYICYLIFQGGVERCIRVLESCLDEQDWSLACLVCQALWNYCIDSNNITESIVDEESLCNLEGTLSH